MILAAVIWITHHLVRFCSFLLAEILFFPNSLNSSRTTTVQQCTGMATHICYELIVVAAEACVPPNGRPSLANVRTDILVITITEPRVLRGHYDILPSFDSMSIGSTQRQPFLNPSAQAFSRESADKNNHKYKFDLHCFTAAFATAQPQPMRSKPRFNCSNYRIAD